MELPARVTRALPLLLLVGLILLSHACGGGEGIALRRDGDTLRFSTPDATAVIETKPFRLSLLGPDGQTLASEGGALSFSQGNRDFVVGEVLDSEQDGRTLQLTVATESTALITPPPEAGDATVLLTWQTDRTLAVELQPPDPTAVTEFSDAYLLTPDELIYGLSERVGVSGEKAIIEDVSPLPSEYTPPEVGSLNRRGEVVEMLVRSTIALYAPFYHSSNGYGLYVAGATPGEFDVGATDPDVLRFRFETGSTPESRSLRYYLV